MNKLGRTLLFILVGLAILIVAVVVSWPWLRAILPHPALVEAWLGYLADDLHIAAWGPIALLLVVALIELVWAVNLSRRGGVHERQLQRLEQLQQKETDLLWQEISQLQAGRQSLLADLDRLDLLVREEEERLWAEFDALQQASDINFYHLATAEPAELPPDLRGEWRRLISQIERIEMVTTIRLQQAPSAAELRRRFFKLVQLGGACYHLGQYERALSHYQRALDLVPADPDAILNHALVNYALGRLPAALRDLDETLKLGESAWAYLYRGLIHERQGENRQALEDYGRAIALEPQLAEGYYRRGLLYAKLGELGKAVQDQSRVLELNSQHAGALTARGVARAALGESELALSDLNESCALAPDMPKTLYHRGCVYRELEMHQQALEDLTRAIELFPAFASAYMARGETYEALHQHRQAVADYGEAINLQPHDTGAHWSRGKARAAMEEYRPAIADFDAALEIDGNLAGVLADRGSAYERLGDHERALQDLDRALELDPGLPGAYYARGLVYGGQGEYDLASRDLNKAVELDPSLRSEQPGALGEEQE